MLEELVKELELSKDAIEKLNGVVEKSIQSETDKVRTEYSKKVKELEQYKPKEKSEAQIELENIKIELANTKFQKSLKEIGIDDNLAKFIKSDCDVKELGEFYKGFNQANKDFIPNKNMGDNSITKEQFKDMNISERTKIYQSNPELYAQLKQ